jgi:hypothetical protein
MPADLSPEHIDTLLARALPPYHEVIGEIASVWAMFEQRLDQLIWDLCDVEHPLGACVTSQLNGPSPRLRTITSLLELRGCSKDTITKLNRFRGKIQTIQEERNRAVHDVILVGHTTERVFKRTVATINNRLIFETVEHSLAALKATFNSSKKLLQDFNVLQEEIRSSLPKPSPETLRKLRERQGPPSERRLSLNQN